MKRNETALVYAVTGLLLFILVVAVIFGQDPNTAQARHLAGGEGGGAATPETKIGGDLFPDLDDPAKEKGKSEPVDPAEIPAKDTERLPKDGPKPEDGPAAQKPGGAVPLNLTPAAKPALTPAMKVAQALGTSSRDGAYRRVTARRGQSLTQLCEDWCGSADRLADVEACNETYVGKTFQGGEPVLVPWVEDDVLVESLGARAARKAELEKQKGKPYVIQKGDSAWRIAARFVPSNKIPTWLRAFKARNPQLVSLDSLREGQTVRLPN